MDDIQLAKRGVPKVNVSFEIDLDGILTVTAQDIKTKSKNSIKIMNSLEMTENEVEEYRKNAILMAEEDVKKTLFSEKYKELFILKKVFEEIVNPSLSTQDQLILDKIENCLDKIHASYEDPEFLMNALMKIIDANEEDYREDAVA